jgi:hypothetical protein
MNEKFLPPDGVNDIADQLCGTADRFAFSPDRQSAALFLLGSLVDTIETNSRPRDHLPERLNRFPFHIGPIRQLFLKLYNLAFRDQRELNTLAAAAMRTSIRLHQLQVQALLALESRVSELEKTVSASLTSHPGDRGLPPSAEDLP